MATAGRILIMPKGAYKSSETYSNLDMVSHNGRCWVAKKVVTGIEPSEENNDYWHDLLGTDLTPEAIGALDKGDIVDNLISESTELALSANQGKVLKELIDTNTNAITKLNSDKFDKTGGMLSDNVSIVSQNSNVPLTIKSGNGTESAYFQGRGNSDASLGFLGFKGVNKPSFSNGERELELFGEHNKPSGSYTGNGSTAERKISVGGIGNWIGIWNNTNGFQTAIIGRGGGFANDNGTFTPLTRAEARFQNGELIIASSNACLNKNGSQFDFDVF